MTKGFTVITETYKSCGLCEYLHFEMIHSGLHPLRHYRCKHPQWQDDYSDNRIIGDSDRTPLWCPFIPKPVEGNRNDF